MCAKELSYDVHVRQSVRAVFVKRAIISTEPTLKGKKEIDAFHTFMVCTIFYRIFFLKNDFLYNLLDYQANGQTSN